MTTYTIVHARRPTAEAKQARGKCIVYQCRRRAGKGRHVCNTCRDRMWRAAHPEHHLWNNLKKSARKRGVEFTITLAEFAAFCAEHDFVARVGREPDAATIDRRDPTLGYTKDNLRVLTNAENARIGGYLSGSGHRQPGQGQLDFAPLRAGGQSPSGPEALRAGGQSPSGPEALRAVGSGPEAACNIVLDTPDELPF